MLFLVHMSAFAPFSEQLSRVIQKILIKRFGKHDAFELLQEFIFSQGNRPLFIKPFDRIYLFPVNSE